MHGAKVKIINLRSTGCDAAWFDRQEETRQMQAEGFCIRLILMQQTTRGYKSNDSDIDRYYCDNLKYEGSRFGYKEGEENGVTKRKEKKAE